MPMTLPPDGVGRHRTGSCHRCGWKKDLLRLNRRDRGLRPEATYRWLCAECAAELDHPAGSASEPGPSWWSMTRWWKPLGLRT